MREGKKKDHKGREGTEWNMQTKGIWKRGDKEKCERAKGGKGRHDKNWNERKEGRIS